MGLNRSLAALSNAAFSNARRNAALRAAVRNQSARRANARVPSPPKRKSPSPPKAKARTPSPPKRKSPSPPKMTIGARVQLPVVITHPNGRIEVKFRTTRGYYTPNKNKPYGYNLSKRMR